LPDNFDAGTDQFVRFAGRVEFLSCAAIGSQDKAGRALLERARKMLRAAHRQAGPFQ
jgi:hypothetical protein